MNVNQFLSRLSSAIITPLLTLMLAVAVLVFIYGVAKFMWDLSNGGDTKEGKSLMLYGIGGFVIMTAAYALIQMMLNTFNITTFH